MNATIQIGDMLVENNSWDGFVVSGIYKRSPKAERETNEEHMATSKGIWICRKESDPVKVKDWDAALLWVAKNIDTGPGRKVFRYIGHGAYEWASYVVGAADAVKAHGFHVGGQKSKR
jgi:hypothetical protein